MEIPDLAARLLIARAERGWLTAPVSPVSDLVERLYRLVRRGPEVERALDAVRADVRRGGYPGYTAKRALIKALADLDGDLGERLDDLVKELARSPERDLWDYLSGDDALDRPLPMTGAASASAHHDREMASARPGMGSQHEASPIPDDDELDIPDFLKNDPVPTPDPTREPSSRFLVAQLPGRAPVDAEVSLIVRVSLTTPDFAATVATIDRLLVPAVRTQVSILVQAPAGLLPVTTLEQRVVVPADRDSEPVRFAFRAQVPGLHRVRVMAFAGGTFLAELETEVSVEPGGPFVDSGPVAAMVDRVAARKGDVTLQVRFDGENTFFQLLSDAYLFEPVLAEALAGGPPAAVERTIATLRQLATGQGPYGPDLARQWMQETGIGLWADMVPAVIKEQFWQLRAHITSFTIATSQDMIPWELLYPLRPGSDDGFMVEQFPVLRRVFGQQSARWVTVAPCTYVLSERSPGNARQEIDMLAAVIGTAGVVDDLGDLLHRLRSGDCGPLHFVCHNSFSADAGSAIAMNGGPFVPGLLNSATIQHTLAATSPLIFLNACRTAGTVTDYHRMTGWAQQFMAAGAGAFVGTLWPVRSDSASTFAQSFYSFLRDGESLGQAALLARRAAVRDGPDPTWLAYTVYGDPHALANPT